MLNKIKVCLIAVSIGAPVVSHANCFTPSPNLTAMGDKYFFLLEKDKFTWNSKEEAEKGTLTKAAKGRWIGEYTQTQCQGTDKNPRLVIKTAEAKAEFQEAMNGILKGHMWMSFTSENKTSSDVLEMFDDRQLFAGKISKDVIEGSQRFSKKNVTGGARLEENIFRVNIKNDSLELTRDIYINGYLAQTDRYRLKRD